MTTRSCLRYASFLTRVSWHMYGVGFVAFIVDRATEKKQAGLTASFRHSVKIASSTRSAYSSLFSLWRAMVTDCRMGGFFGGKQRFVYARCDILLTELCLSVFALISLKLLLYGKFTWASLGLI